MDGRRIARRLLLGTGSLKRGTDQAEMIFRLLLLVAVIAAAPIGILQGTATYDHEGGITPEQARGHQAVRAVVLADPLSADVLPPDALVQVPVTFTAPDGTPISTTVEVWATTRANDRITLWVSPEGRLTGPPEERQPSLGNAAWVGATTGLAAPIAAWALLGLAHLALDTRRYHQWQSEWITVEPVWTSRRP